MRDTNYRVESAELKKIFKYLSEQAGYKDFQDDFVIQFDKEIYKDSKGDPEYTLITLNFFLVQEKMTTHVCDQMIQI